MRPEGCQETRAAPATISRNLQISNQFWPRLLDALESETYTQPMTIGASRSSPCARRVRARVAAARSSPRRSSGRMYVSVARRRGRAGPRPRARRLRRPRRQRRARSADVAPATEPMQIAVLVDTSQAARDDISRHPHGAAAVRRGADRRRGGRRTRSRSSRIGERPTILTDYTTDRADAAEGHRPHLVASPAAGAYLLDGIIEVSQGIQEARGRSAR